MLTVDPSTAIIQQFRGRVPDAYTQQGLFNEGCTSGASLHATKRGVDSIQGTDIIHRRFSDQQNTRNTNIPRHVGIKTVDLAGDGQLEFRGQSGEPKWTYTPPFQTSRNAHALACENDVP